MKPAIRLQAARVTAEAPESDFRCRHKRRRRRFPLRWRCPAAGDFQLRVAREGFFLLTDKAAHLDSATPVEVHLTHLRELAESIDVKYAPPQADPDQTSEVKHIDGQEILNLPYAASQDYRQALQLMPGAIQDAAGQVHFNGGESYQTSYRLDGFDVSNAATGGLSARLSVDTVQEVEWNSARMPAEDKGSAGTVEIRTEMGDDRWRFGGTNPIPVHFHRWRGASYDHWSPRLMTSGPIRQRENLVPYGARSVLHSGYSGLSAARAEPYEQLHDERSFAVSVEGLRTGKPLRAAFSTIAATRGATVCRYSRPLRRPPISGLRFLPQPSKTSSCSTAILSKPDSRIRASYVRTSPLGTEPYEMTPFGASGNFFRDQSSRISRQEALANAVFRPLRAAGTHQVRIGG